MHSDESSDDSRLLIRDILIYLIKDQDAKTPRRASRTSGCGANRASGREKIREALKYLSEDKRWLTQKNAGAALTLYGLDKAYIDEIQDFLRA